MRRSTSGRRTGELTFSSFLLNKHTDVLCGGYVEPVVDRVSRSSRDAHTIVKVKNVRLENPMVCRFEGGGPAIFPNHANVRKAAPPKNTNFAERLGGIPDT